MSRQEELMRTKMRKFVGAQNRLKALSTIVHCKGAARMDRKGATAEAAAVESELDGLKEELSNL